MGLKRLLFTFPLLFSACITAPSSGAFIYNVYGLRLKLPNQSASSIGIDTGLGRITARSSDGLVDDTVTIIKDWSPTKALARHVNRAGITNYINLQITGGALYRSDFFNDEGSLSASTPAGNLYLDKSSL